jgi:hypothetical protein
MFIYVIRFLYFHPSPGFLLIQQRGPIRDNTYIWFNFFPINCTACTTLGAGNGENGTFSKLVQEIVTYILIKYISSG